MAISLRGPAATVLTNLPPGKRQDYGTLTAALDTHFGLAHQTELNRMRLKARTRCREETLAELAEDVERLVRLAYPEAAEAMVEVLTQDQFIDALSEEDMRLRIRQNKPASLRDALRIALELESYQLASKQKVRLVREAQLEVDYPMQWQGNHARSRRRCPATAAGSCPESCKIAAQVRQWGFSDLLGVQCERSLEARMSSVAEEPACQ